MVSVYVYPDSDYKQVLEMVNETSPYALTGAVYSQDPWVGIYGQRDHFINNFSIVIENLMEIAFCFYPNSNELITTNFRL